MISKQDQFMVSWYLLAEYLIKENMGLQKDLERMTQELAETDHGVMVLMIENLQMANEEQKKKIREQETALLEAEKLTSLERLASLGYLVAGVAHEINNPTTYIRANIELLRKCRKKITEQADVSENEKVRIFEESCDDTLESMYKGTERIMDIVSGLKFFAGQEKGSYEVFNLNDCIAEAYKLVKNEFVRNKTNFIIRTVKNAFYIQGSRQQIEQVFVNLFLNSITAIKKHRSSNNGFVEINIKSSNHGELLIEVRDNGCGIAKDNLKLIFNPFFTTNQSFGGTGLGLSIILGIIKGHGGSIEVKSEENEGTEFSIILPEKHTAASRKNSEPRIQDSE